MALINNLNRIDFHIWHDDFDRFVVTDWVITTTELGGGDASEALTAGDGGLLLITNDNADNDLDFLQWSGGQSIASPGTVATETFRYASGKKLLFSARFKVSDATESDFVMGLQITNTAFIATVTDGIWFQKDDGDAALDFHVVKNSTATSATNIATVSNDTFIKVAFFYPGAGSLIYYYTNDVLMGTSVLTNVPDDEDLTVTFGIQNGTNAAKTMTVDYITVAKER